MDSPLQHSRYPGIRAFERSETAQFFGRQRETQELFSMVKVKPLTVLFAKSGIGKTSLINAGLGPLLEQNGYLPIKIRLQDTALSPVETVKKVLEHRLNRDLLKRYGQAPFSLWEYLRACNFESGSGEAQVPVLVFDQFEELFNHPRDAQLALTLALADLINDRLPDAVQARFRSFPRQERSDEMLHWFSPQKIRVLFAIRTDRMGELDRLKQHIPTVLHDRFYLRPLGEAEAREAIVQPAALREGNYQTAPFGYSEAALQSMLQGLENDNGEVESFQLQILCQQIEKIAAERGLKQINPDDFGGAEGINTILNDYYEREIGKLPEAEQAQARRFIEEGLIVNGRRVGMPEGAENTRFGVSEALLNRLLESRLIRTEIIHLGKIYELSHDTLVEPVLRSYEQRRIAEERAEAMRALEQERARLRELSKKRRRARLFAIAGFGLATLALIGGVLAWLNYRKAETARQSANVSALAAKAWEVYRDDHTLAFRLAEAALQLDSTNTYARQTLRGIANTATTTFYQTVFRGHNFEIEALAFSPDGKLIASGSFDKSVAIWQPDGRVVARLNAAESTSGSSGHSATVRAVVFSPDGQSVWSAGKDGWVKRIDLNANVTGGFAAHPAAVWDMALSPDGRWLVTASNDSTAAVWKTDGTRLHTLRGHNNAVWAVDISPDGQKIASGSVDGTARIWSAGGQLLRLIDLNGIKVNAMAFSPDSRYVLLGCGDNTAKLYSLDGRLQAIYSGHTAEITQVAFSPDGKQVLTASNDHSAKLWQRSGEELLRLVGHTERVGALAISPDGEWVATGSFDFTAKLWNLPFNLKNKAARHDGPVDMVAVSPDGSSVLSGSVDNTVKRWSIKGELLNDLHNHLKEVAQVGFSPTGNQFFSTSPDGTVRIWDTSGVLRRSLKGFPANVYAADYSPLADGALLAASGPDLFLLDSAGVLLRRWETHSGGIARVQFSPDGKSLLSAGRNGLIEFWSREGILIDSINVGLPLYWATYAPDGKYIATSAFERPVREWSLSDTTSRQYVGHLDVSYFIGYSPDGRYLVSCSWDKTARLWDRSSGTAIQVFPHPDGVNSAAFTLDGRLLVTACRDKFVRVWDVASGKLLRVFGDDLDVDRFLNSSHIASLESIPFSFERYGIAADMALSIYGKKPELLRSMGQRYLELANNYLHDLKIGQEYTDKAEFYIKRAAEMDPQGSSRAQDSLLAEVYLCRANLYLSHGKYREMLAAAEDGLQHRPLPMLNVYRTFGLLLTDRFDQARRLALELCKDSTTAVPPYYDSYRMALGDEQYYYQHELGIRHPDWERFEKVLEAQK
ncbi:MAG: hypothetical protein KDC65_09910 [Saprospiraceae bacterium]|nr:hypothetical protein [Saprospiraceae bacterium]